MSRTKQPTTPRRPDHTRNPDGLEAVIEKQRRKEKSLHMLRVSRNTWIVVPKRKNNPKYVDSYRRDVMKIKEDE